MASVSIGGNGGGRLLVGLDSVGAELVGESRELFLGWGGLGSFVDVAW